MSNSAHNFDLRPNLTHFIVHIPCVILHKFCCFMSMFKYLFYSDQLSIASWQFNFVNRDPHPPLPYSNKFLLADASSFSRKVKFFLLNRELKTLGLEAFSFHHPWSHASVILHIRKENSEYNSNREVLHWQIWLPTHNIYIYVYSLT